MKSRLSRILVLCLALVAVVSPTLAAAQSLSVRFSWKYKGEYVPFFVAQEDHLYTAQHLDVSLGEGAGAQAVLTGIVHGNDDVAIIPAPFALTAISKGAPVKIVALYQPIAPLAVVSMPSKPIRAPKDMLGKTIGVTVGDTVAQYLNVLCKKNQLGCSKIQTVTMDPQVRASQFLVGHVDALSSYTTVDVPVIQGRLPEHGLVVMPLAPYGLSLPGMAVVVKASDVETRKAELSKFLLATSEAIKVAKADPGKATDITRRAWPTSPELKVIRAQIDATLASIPQPAVHEAGWIDESILRETLDLLASSGDIAAPMPVGAYYSNSLLK